MYRVEEAPYNEFNGNQVIGEMKQVAEIFDIQPIRTSSFCPTSPDYFVLGSSSKSLKFCKISPSVFEQFGIMMNHSDLLYMHDDGIHPFNEIKMIYEKKDHHMGSIYCVDWSRTGNLIATGSNDTMIKVIIAPDLKTR